MPRGSNYRIIFRSLVSKGTKGMVFGTRVLECWVLGTSGMCKVKKVSRSCVGVQVGLSRAACMENACMAYLTQPHHQNS